MRKSRPPKMVLNNALLEEEFFEEVALLGIVCEKQPHRFIWELNRGFDIHLVRDHQLQVQKEEIIFPVYGYENTLKQSEHFVFVNRRERTFLLPELKNVDYIWMIKCGSFLTSEKKHVMSGLNQFPNLHYFSEISAESLPSKSLLII